eukprot:s234_g15.t1
MAHALAACKRFRTVGKALAVAWVLSAAVNFAAPGGADDRIPLESLKAGTEVDAQILSKHRFSGWFVNIGTDRSAFLEFEEACDGFPTEGMNTWLRGSTLTARVLENDGEKIWLTTRSGSLERPKRFRTPPEESQIAEFSGISSERDQVLDGEFPHAMPRDWVRKAPRTGWSPWHGSAAMGDFARKEEVRPLESVEAAEEPEEETKWNSLEAETEVKLENRAEQERGNETEEWGVPPGFAFSAPAWEWSGAGNWLAEDSAEAGLRDDVPLNMWYGEDGEWYGDNFFGPAMWGTYEEGADGFIGRRHGQVPKRANLKEQFEKEQFEKGDAAKKVTTLMLRNVPNAYDREALMAELANLGFEGSFDFLYLPIDTSTKNNVGYAFVNFCDEEACMKCMNALRGYFFKGQPYNRRRPAIVSVAHLQGLEANLQHYSRTQVFNARLPCQRPWVAREAATALALADCQWAPGGFAKLMEDAAARPGTQPDTQSLIHRRRARERWMFHNYGLAAYDMMPDGGFGPGDQPLYSNDTPRYHNPGQVVHEGMNADMNAQALKQVEDKESQLANTDKPSGPDQNRTAVSVLSRMLRGESVDHHDLPEEDEEMDSHGLDLLVPEIMPVMPGAASFDEWYGWPGLVYNYEYAMPGPSGPPGPPGPQEVPGKDEADTEKTTVVLTNVPRGFSAQNVFDVLKRLEVYEFCRGLCFLDAETGYAGQRTSVLQFNSVEQAEIAKKSLVESTWGGDRKGENAKIQVEDLLTHDLEQFSAGGTRAASSWEEEELMMPDYTDQWEQPSWLTAARMPDDYAPPKTGMEFLGQESDLGNVSPEGDMAQAEADGFPDIPAVPTSMDVGSPSAPADADDSSAPTETNRQDQFLEDEFDTSWPKLPSKAKKSADASGADAFPEWVDAEVCGMFPKGAWVRMTTPSTRTDFRCLLRKEQFTESFVEQSHIGMKIQVRVLEVNLAQKQLYLSMLEPQDVPT